MTWWRVTSVLMLTEVTRHRAQRRLPLQRNPRPEEPESPSVLTVVEHRVDLLAVPHERLMIQTAVVDPTRLPSDRPGTARPTEVARTTGTTRPESAGTGSPLATPAIRSARPRLRVRGRKSDAEDCGQSDTGGE
jgi:hypothetical protein